MPINRTGDFSSQFFDYLDNKQAQWKTQPTYLGGASGSNGGTGTTVGGFVGKLAQRYIAYDTTEASTYSTSSTPSILDNLNHIRAMISGSGGGALPYTSTPISVGMYGTPGSSPLYSRGDHQHFHGQLSNGDLHTVFTTGSNGFVPAPVTSTGLFLRDDATWAAASGGSGGSSVYPYNFIPASIASYGLVGTSGSYSRGDHTHFHGQLVGGNLHSVFTAGSAGFTPAPVTSTGKFLRDDATWATPASGSSGTNTYPYNLQPANVNSYSYQGSSGSFAMGDHVHFHGQLVGGNLHSTFSTGSHGFVPAPGSASGKVLSDAGTWVSQTGGNAYPYNLTPANVGSASAGTSGSYSMGDHVHGHGNQSASGAMHAVSTQANAGFLRQLATTGSYLDSTGNWSVPPTGGSGVGGGGYPYTLLPANVGTASAGTSGSYSRGDHIHAHGAQPANDTMHALSTQANAGFLRQLTSTSGSYLNSIGNWSVPAGGSATPLSGMNPQPLGTATPGSSGSASKDDHVHAHGNMATGAAYHANATNTNPGFLPTLDNIGTHFLNGQGSWATPPSSGSGGGSANQNLIVVVSTWPGYEQYQTYPWTEAGLRAAITGASYYATIYLPPGVVTLTSDYNITYGSNAHVAIKGSGRNATRINGSGYTIYFNSGSDTDMFWQDVGFDGPRVWCVPTNFNITFSNCYFHTVAATDQTILCYAGYMYFYDCYFVSDSNSGTGRVFTSGYSNVISAIYIYNCRIVAESVYTICDPLSGSMIYVYNSTISQNAVLVNSGVSAPGYVGFSGITRELGSSPILAPSSVMYPSTNAVWDTERSSGASHARDISSGSPRYHVLAGSTAEDTLIWDGGKWTTRQGNNQQKIVVVSAWSGYEEYATYPWTEQGLRDAVANATYYATIYLPPGAVSLTSDLYVNYGTNRHVVLKGASRDGTQIGGGGYTFYFYSGSDLSFFFQDLTLVDCMVRIDQPNLLVTFNNCYIHTNSSMDNTVFAFQGYYWMYNCYIQHDGSSGVSVVLMTGLSSSSSGAWIFNCRIIADSAYSVCDPRNGAEIYIYNCTISPSATLVNAGISAPGQVVAVEISRENGGSPILLPNSTVPISTNAAWDTAHVPTYHAKDLYDGVPVYHLPTTSSDGYVPAWSAASSKWVAAAPGGGVSLSDNNPASVGTTAHGAGTAASRDDHVHAHGNQSGGTLHSNFGTSTAGFVPSPGSVAGKVLSDGATWVSLPSSTQLLIYNGIPNTVGGANLAGSSGSVSRGDHQHYHGQLQGGNYHSTFTAGSHGFVPAPGTASSGSVLTAAGSWAMFAYAGSVPTTLTATTAAATGSSGSFARSDHAHAITSGSNVSAGTQSILASDTGGGLTLHHLNAGAITVASAVGTMAAAAAISSYGLPLSTVRGSTVNAATHITSSTFTLPVTGTWKQATFFGSLRSTNPSVTDILKVVFNGVATGYYQTSGRSSGSTSIASEVINGTSLQFEVNGGNALANSYSPFKMELYDYAPQSGSASHYISWQAQWGAFRAASSGSIYTFQASGMLNSAGLVSSVAFSMTSGSIAQYSSIENVLLLA